MEIELQANDHKGGWKNCWMEDLLERIPEEYQELLEAVKSGNLESIISEAADVANFAMMVADIAYRYGLQSREAVEHKMQRTACPECGEVGLHAPACPALNVA